MRKRALWLVAGSLTLLSTVIAGCGTAPSATTPTGATPKVAAPAATIPTGITPTAAAAAPTSMPKATDAPKYGGTLNLALTADVANWEPLLTFGGTPVGLEQEPLMQGDWTKGNAEGYGTSESDWGAANNDLISLKTGGLATDFKYSADAANDTVTAVFDIRPGVHWALNPNSEASKLVNGREVTVDDVIFSFQRLTSWQRAGLYIFRPEFHDAVITKTGPQQVSVTVKGIGNLILLNRLADLAWIEPPEVVQKYGDMNAWDRQEGTGPFMLTKYVSASELSFTRNPSYWMTDPIGPGKGNQLPYLDGVNVFVMPDPSTQLTALRTGKIDELANIARDDAASIKQTSPQLSSSVAPSNAGQGTPLGMRMDKPGLPWGPQDDPNALKVRQAMMMAIDYQGILKNYYGGEGQIATWPQAYVKEYAGLYLGLDDPQFPASGKELYSYNPTKAKQLLTDAGYPNGFSCSVVLTQDETDYYSMIKQYWSAVGINLTFDIQDPSSKTHLYQSRTFPEMITGTTGPVSSWYTNGQMWGTSWANISFVDDPVINQGIADARALLPDRQDEAEAKYKQLAIYVQDKAYVIPNVIGYSYYFWQPWLKNYSGEQNVGFGYYSWPKYIWYDQALKQKMGY